MFTRIIGTLAYRAAQIIVNILAHGLWRMKIQGTENIPKTGPFILAPNHRSNVDGPLTVILTRRRMRYLAKAEMFSVAGPLYIAMGAIAVKRGEPDRASLKACFNALNSGLGLVLFPGRYASEWARKSPRSTKGRRIWLFVAVLPWFRSVLDTPPAPTKRVSII